MTLISDIEKWRCKSLNLLPLWGGWVRNSPNEGGGPGRKMRMPLMKAVVIGPGRQLP